MKMMESELIIQKEDTLLTRSPCFPSQVNILRVATAQGI